MKKFLMIAFVIATSLPCYARTLEGSVEKTEILEIPSITEFSKPKSKLGRIGVRISKTGHISFVHPGSPADRAGLRRKDIVTLVDGMKKHIEYISGEPGTIVNLEVKRGSEIFVLDIPRTDVKDIRYDRAEFRTHYNEHSQLGSLGVDEIEVPSI